MANAPTVRFTYDAEMVDAENCIKRVAEPAIFACCSDQNVIVTIGIHSEKKMLKTTQKILPYFDSVSLKRESLQAS